jgi:hypothetical protein
MQIERVKACGEKNMNIKQTPRMKNGKNISFDGGKKTFFLQQGKSHPNIFDFLQFTLSEAAFGLGSDTFDERFLARLRFASKLSRGLCHRTCLPSSLAHVCEEVLRGKNLI